MALRLNPTGGNGSKGIVIITEFIAPAAAGAGGATYISSVLNNSFIITHANNAQVDRTFDFACIGG